MLRSFIEEKLHKKYKFLKIFQKASSNIIIFGDEVTHW